ncbi:MAG: hypothetical protein LUE86_08790 [Clostridiales bacterium]|nr:hypothetical protein [Clostridiales bacterium]
MERKTLFLIAGRTASGKSSVTKEVCKDLGLIQVRSYAIRPMRPDEAADPEHSDHIFITEDEMEQYRDDITAYTYINGSHYFTTTDILDRSDCYVIDPLGIKDLKARYKERYRFVIIELRQRDKNTALKRYLKRKGTKETFEARWADEDAQFTEFESDIGIGSRNSTHVIHTTNRTKRQVVEVVKKIIIEEKLKGAFSAQQFEDVLRRCASSDSITEETRTLLKLCGFGEDQLHRLAEQYRKEKN